MIKPITAGYRNLDPDLDISHSRADDPVLWKVKLEKLLSLELHHHAICDGWPLACHDGKVELLRRVLGITGADAAVVAVLRYLACGASRLHNIG